MRALILGGAETVWDDVARSEELLGEDWWDVVVAANDVGVHWERRLDHWCSLHTDKLTDARKGWALQREKAGGNTDFVTWGKRGRKFKAEREVSSWGGGASGLLAVAVAREVGAVRAVLCGIPMDRRPHFTESKVHMQGRKWSSADSHWKAWKKEKTAKKLMGWVKSMSGRTREFLGEPTPEWLAETEEVA